MARVGNGVINIYDKFTTRFSKMMINVPPAVVYLVETIETIEIVNDVFNPSTPASTSKGQGINIIRGLIGE